MFVAGFLDIGAYMEHIFVAMWAILDIFQTKCIRWLSGDVQKYRHHRQLGEALWSQFS